MNRLKGLTVGIVAVFALLSVTGIGGATESDKAGGTARSVDPQEGAAFAMTNTIADNRIVTYRRAANGHLTRLGSISTRGNGIGTDLDTQGGLRLSRDHRYLYAVNAGSDNITVFSVNGPNLTFVQKVYAGDEPNSLTLHGNLLYVLDGSVAGNGIRGFHVAANGALTPLSGSFRLLSSPIAVPGQVEFSPDGHTLLVTHKTTNELLPPRSAIDAFTVGGNGLASATPKRNASSGLRPFSLAFRKDGKVVVAESFNAAPGRSAVSSYQSAGNALNAISGSVANHQTDTCWIVVDESGRHAYTANFGSGTISSYRFDAGGNVHLIRGNAAFLGAKSQPVDLAFSTDSHYLYLLLRGTGSVASFRIDDAHLVRLGIVTGALPVNDGASGLASF